MPPSTGRTPPTALPGPTISWGRSSWSWVTPTSAASASCTPGSPPSWRSGRWAGFSTAGRVWTTPAPSPSAPGEETGEGVLPGAGAGGGRLALPGAPVLPRSHLARDRLPGGTIPPGTAESAAGALAGAGRGRAFPPAEAAGSAEPAPPPPGGPPAGLRLRRFAVGEERPPPRQPLGHPRAALPADGLGRRPGGGRELLPRREGLGLQPPGGGHPHSDRCLALPGPTRRERGRAGGGGLDRGPRLGALPGEAPPGPGGSAPARPAHPAQSGVEPVPRLAGAPGGPGELERGHRAGGDPEHGHRHHAAPRGRV